MSTASSGRSREHRVRDELIGYGWHLVARSAGSKGAADLVMVHPVRGLALIQVGTGNKTLGPADRERLCDLADLCGALPLLATVIPREGIAWRVVDRGRPAKWSAWSPSDEPPW